MTNRFLSLLLFFCVLAWSPRTAAQVNMFSNIYFTDYSACVKSPAEPSTVQFGTDSVGITDWWWTFGNGQQSFVASPVAEYGEPGNYTVTLTIENMMGMPFSIVKEKLIQVNELLFEDDFENPGFSALHWVHFEPDLIVDSALDFEVRVVSRHQGEQNGRIICLNGGGEGTPTPQTDGRFFFDLELIAEDSRTVSYTAFRLLDGGNQTLAALRVQRERGAFKVRIESPQGESTWHALVQPNPVLSVGLDWYRSGAGGGLSVELKEGVQPVAIQHLDLINPPEYQFLQFGVMRLDWPDDGTRAGRVRVDNFSTCAFEHRPDSP